MLFSLMELDSLPIQDALAHNRPHCQQCMLLPLPLILPTLQRILQSDQCPVCGPEVAYETFVSNAILTSGWNTLTVSFPHRSNVQNRWKDLALLASLPVTVGLDT